jgi:hypothetical protein
MAKLQLLISGSQVRALVRPPQPKPWQEAPFEQLTFQAVFLETATNELAE